MTAFYVGRRKLTVTGGSPVEVRLDGRLIAAAPSTPATFELAAGDAAHPAGGIGPGLSGVLSGRATLADAVRPSGIDGLDVLPCGPLPHNPAELLDSQVLLDLLGEAAGRYDQVVIDSPPINVVSDARILAASCDAAVVVLRAERSTRRAATQAWAALAAVGARRLGVIVNDVTRRADGYGYNYYGAYGYGTYAGGRSTDAAPGDPDDDANGTPTNGRRPAPPKVLAAAAPTDRA